MAGKVKMLIDSLIEQRSQGNEAIASTTRTKLLLKGVNTTIFTDDSDDDPAAINVILQVANEMGISLEV
ncbi:MAG: hypothetical protein GX268_09675 [Methanomicrobiales archaeon]|jgi:hypothetical protein|nr:hypothetical protein [Methanomicrobiales archaeon]